MLFSFGNMKLGASRMARVAIKKVSVSTAKIAPLFKALGGPVKFAPRLLGDNGETRLRAEQEAFENTTRGIAQYFGLYDGEATDYARVLFRFAQAIGAPCTQVETGEVKSRGRKRNPVNNRLDVMVDVVTELRNIEREDLRTVSEACRRLSRLGRYKPKGGPTIETMYYEAQKEFRERRGFDFCSAEHVDEMRRRGILAK